MHSILIYSQYVHSYSMLQKILIVLSFKYLLWIFTAGLIYHVLAEICHSAINVNNKDSLHGGQGIIHNPLEKCYE